MASWILVPCLVTLRTEFNALAPGRRKASDGSIGDTSHAASSSDHNPDETGNTPYEDADNLNEVHAIDVDSDLRKSGWTMQRAVNVIVDRHRSGADDRLQNVIYNRKIASRSWGWTWRDYTGSSPHTEHAHFSSRYTTSQESDTSPWGLLEEDDNVSTQDVIDALKSSEGKAAILSALVDGKYGNEVYPNRTIKNFLRDVHGMRDYLIGDATGAKKSSVLSGSWIKNVEGMPATLKTLSTALATIAANVAADDKDLPTILAALDQVAADVLAGLGSTASTTEAAAMLREIYGPERAAEIGDLLTAKPA